MRVLGFMLFILVGAYAHAADQSSLERRKIDYLIASVETLQDAQFVRNGKSYTPQAAAEHLRLKLGAAGARIVTADDFIRLCASVSSISGIPYQVRFADGHLVTSEEYLRQKLTDFVRKAADAP